MAVWLFVCALLKIVCASFVFGAIAFKISTKNFLATLIGLNVVSVERRCIPADVAEIIALVVKGKSVVISVMGSVVGSIVVVGLGVVLSVKVKHFPSLVMSWQVLLNSKVESLSIKFK